MRFSIISVLSISLLFLVQNSQTSLIAPSYSFYSSGTFVRTISGQTPTTSIITRYNVFIDQTRMLGVVDEVGTVNGAGERAFALVSFTDSLSYISANGVCTSRANTVPNLAALSLYPWNDILVNGTESPPGTYTLIQPDGSIVLITTDGLPSTVASTVTSGSTTLVTTLTISRFSNEAPSLTNFRLPSECSAFTCSTCYSSGVRKPNSQTSLITPSYSFESSGTLVITTSGQTPTTRTITRYNVFIDQTRMLGAIDEVGTANGIEIRSFELVSFNDNLSYQNINGVCSTRAIIVPNLAALSPPWNDILVNGTESPSGTYTLTQVVGRNTVLIITNGLPSSLTSTFTFGSTTFVTSLSITRFTNEAPPFSDFRLPSECSTFTCSTCYSSGVRVVSSLLTFLSTLVVVLYATF